MGLGYQFSGDPVRALDSYELFTPKQPVKEFDDVTHAFRPMALDQRGCLAEAESCARAALAQPDLVEDQDLVCLAMIALGAVLLHRGLSEQVATWLENYRDALNVLSRVERAAGDTNAAAEAAREAYLQAWCDGPPFSCAVGLDEARANLSAVGAPEPDCPDFEPGEPFPEVLVKPTPRAKPT